MSLGFHRNDTRGLKRFGRADETNRAEFRAELQGMIDHLYNAACIAVWVPFNESWGQFQAREIAEWVQGLRPDPPGGPCLRLVRPGRRRFSEPARLFEEAAQTRRDRRAFVITEFGGYSLKIPGHVWDEEKKFGYRFYESSEALTAPTWTCWKTR